MKRIFSLILVCVFVVGMCVPMASADNGITVAEGRSNESKWLSLSKNETGARYFVDADGNPVNLWGMARCQYHASEEDTIFSAVPSIDALAKHYADLNCNFMRLAIDMPSSIQKEGGGVSKEDINNFITKSVDPDVQAIIRSGMYVMLDVHMYPPEPPEGVNGAQWTVQYAYDNYLPFLIELVKKYENEPMVAVIELWNEPYPADQTTLKYDVQEWTKLVRDFFIDGVNELRKYDQRHVFLISDYNAGWGCAIPVTWNGYYEQIDPEYRNTAHSVHICDTELDQEFDFYEGWYNDLANDKNLCLLFGEIETEGDLMTPQGIINLTNMYTAAENTHHYSGVLWRPHNDEVNYVEYWKDWAKEYIKNVPTPEFREIIEAENFADKSGTAEIAKNIEMFGAPSVGTGIKILPNQAPNKYYEASPLNNDIYEPGTYSLTVTALGSASDCGGFTVGYKTVSGKVVQLADMVGNNTPGELYDQTINFTCDEQIAGFVFFSNETEKMSVAIDRLYLVADSSYKATKKSKITLSPAATVTDLEGNVFDANADLSDMVVEIGGARDYLPALIVMGSIAVVLVGLIVANGIVLKKRKKNTP